MTSTEWIIAIPKVTPICGVLHLISALYTYTFYLFTQVYKGLNIITNKVTSEEQREIPHHMINIVSPPSEFTVVQFKNMALNIIKDLHTQKKIPIIVGVY